VQWFHSSIEFQRLYFTAILYLYNIQERESAIGVKEIASHPVSTATLPNRPILFKRVCGYNIPAMSEGRVSKECSSAEFAKDSAGTKE
jgi:hypothetical protein